MRPFSLFPETVRKHIRYVLTDIDDTLTCSGRLLSAVFFGMERLQRAGIGIIPITGRPAGWCDHIARMWPIDAVVGENGAFYFHYDVLKKKMIRKYWKSNIQRNQDRKKLDDLKKIIIQRVPGCRVSSDQAYREADLAIDFCEDVPPMPIHAVMDILRCFEDAGAQAKISSIHVNGWFGEYDKLTMTHRVFDDIFNISLDDIKEQVIFIGDSPNDTPLFAYFPHSVGVANIVLHRDMLPCEPAWMTQKEGGHGFYEMVNHLLST